MNVMLYALSTCIHCRNTKNFLSENNIAYDFVDVDTLEGEQREKIIEEVKNYNPKISFPTLVYKDKVVVGYRPDEILQAIKS